MLPLEYKRIIPEDKYITDNNPPKLEIEFFKNQKNLNKINCFSDEGAGWKETKIKYDINRFGTDRRADKYLKSSNNRTIECLCSFNGY